MNKIAKKPFFDPSIPRKSGLIDSALAEGDGGFPLPAFVEISESGTCNRVCSFCPRSAPDYEDIKDFIKDDLLRKLASQLGEAGFEGPFNFSGFSEPLIDKRIFEKVAIVRECLPNNRIEMVTNGDVLDETRLLKLFEAGLSTLLISVYDGQEEYDALEKLCRDAGLRDDQFVMRKRYLSAEEDFGLTINNRAGMLDNTEYVLPSLAEPLDRPCYYPSYLFFMDYQGDVLMCPHDWGKRKIIGNMNFQDFSEIWTSQVATNLRKRLNQRNRHFSPCDVCDVKGTYMGKKNAEKWAALGNYELVEVED